MCCRAQADNIAYQDNDVRFTVISDGVIRMEYTTNKHFTDDKSFIAVNRNYPTSNYSLSTDNGWIEINTTKMKLRYKKGSGRFSEKNLFITSNDSKFQFSWHPGVKQKGNLKGTYRTLDGMDGDTQTQTWVSDTKPGDKLKLEDGLLATDGWTFIDDSNGLLFDGNTDWEWVKERKSKNNQDWYFMAYGHDYKAALKDYTLFAGKIPLPPRYAFGYWWSRYWMYSDNEIRNLINKFQMYHIPLDVLVIDMDWHYTEKGKGGWTGWTWNKSLFPNPKKFLAYLKNKNLKITLNLHPADGIASYEKGYADLAKDMGIEPSSKKTIPWISSDKKFMTNMFKDILDPMTNDGVDFWWLDWQQGIYDSKIKTLKNTWWINYAFFSKMENDGNKRPLLYHRWGGLGNHRYQVGFSGDAIISWKSLDYQPYFNATASNVLYGYWSHDLGGHIGENIDPEMYTRWLQFGALSPIMRTHSTKNAGLNKEPWVFSDEYCTIISNTIRQRYEMLPYIYTMARKGYDEGLSLCRPMYYDYPENHEAYEFKNEYMFGDNILVAPATSPATDGYTAVKLWLPEGNWYELSTGTIVNGDRTLTRNFAIDEYPIYVKANSILPFYTDEVMNLDNNDEDIIVTVFPGKDGHSEFNLYEDNGNDKGYAENYAITKLSSDRNATEQTIIIGKRNGNYKDMPSNRHFKVKLLQSAMPLSVTVNGKPADYEYLGDEFAVLIDVPVTSCDIEKVIKISHPNSTVKFNGLQGITKRIAKAMEQMKYRSSYIVYKEEFSNMGSIREAVTYSPENMTTLVSDFWNSYNQLPALLKQQEMKDSDINWFLKSINY